MAYCHSFYKEHSLWETVLVDFREAHRRAVYVQKTTHRMELSLRLNQKQNAGRRKEGPIDQAVTSEGCPASPL